MFLCSLTGFAQYVKQEQLADNVAKITLDQAEAYLHIRSEEVGQKTLDMDRQAIQCMLQHYSHKLEPDEKLPVVKSELNHILASQAYTPDQVEMIIERQSESNALATEIACDAGLRAHGLLTICPIVT